MTTAQHTPGPWAFDDADPRTRFVIRSAGGTVVAVASPLPHAPDFPEREANAHILAAAPDLLAALERLDYGIGNGADDNEWNAACEQARAAIAKARGRQ
jgi:hypothetical protein